MRSPSEEEFDDRVHHTTQKLQTFWDTKPEERDVDDDADRTVVWQVINTDVTNFFIGTKSNNHHYEIRYTYSLIEDILDSIDEVQAKGILEETDEELVEDLRGESPDLEARNAETESEVTEDHWIAANIRTSLITDQSHVDLLLKIGEMCSTNDLYYATHQGPVDDNITGVNVYTRAFPYDVNLSSQDWFDKASKVQTTGHYMEGFMRYAFNIGGGFQVPEESEWEVQTPRL